MKRVSVLISFLIAVFVAVASVSFAWAVEAVDVKADTKVLDLTAVTEFYQGDGDRLQVSTAPGPDGIVQRIEVRARQSGAIPGWVVFALSNNTDRQMDRYIVVPHFRMSGSGLLKPDLGAQRVASISTSQGFAPERIPDTEADVFLVTLDPGNVVTFVMELSHSSLPGLNLWEPGAYKDYVNSYTFFRGIVLGISGLLALFLIILFVVKGAAMFPAAALLAWSVLAYLAIDFGFMGRLFDIPTASEPIWRAVAEVVFSTSILILLFTYLTLHRWHVRYLHASGIWLVFLIVVLGIALFDPSLGAGIARLSMVVTSVAGFAVILYLAFTGFDRAIMLIPTWILLLLWLAASGAAVAGVLGNDLVQPALSAGLVLLVLLFCFTIMQHAFSGGILAQGIVSDSERRALAVVGSGDMVWDWDVPRDRIYASSEAERLLGLKHGALTGHARDWLELLHPQDRDRFSSMLDAIIEQRRGRVNQDFRLRADDGHYRWFKLRVRPVVGTDGEVVRCVGTLLDITHQRTTEERMLHDAVHDNLTGLANRELLQDRLASAMVRCQVEGAAKPAVLLIDIDDFRTINDSFGLSVGDSVLLTVARRLSRLLKPQDSIARFYGDQFAIILLSEQQPERIAVFADSVRKVLKVPVVFGNKELTLSVSTGIAIHDMQVHQQASDILNDSELALYHAKRLGGDRIEPFRPSLRQQGRGRGPLDRDLQDALQKNEIDVLFQPIVGLEDRQIKGFEALARWQHPQRGSVPPADFIPAAERTGLIVPLGLYILEQAARQLSQWQHKMDGMEQLFMSVNISSQQLMGHDLLSDVKTVLSRCNVNPGTLKLELTESQVMENPEYANQVLGKLRALGAGLSLDDFGTGYSSLAYLQHFPFDTLKIDKSFVGHKEGAAPVILQSIVRLAQELRLNLVAEGVENEEAANQLVAMGCPLAQGYLFGKPLTAPDAVLMLETQVEQAKQQQAKLQQQEREQARKEAENKAQQEQQRREEQRRKEAAELQRAQEHARKVAAGSLPEPEIQKKVATPEQATKKAGPTSGPADTLEAQLAAGLAASIAADALTDEANAKQPKVENQTAKATAPNDKKDRTAQKDAPAKKDGAGADRSKATEPVKPKNKASEAKQDNPLANMDLALEGAIEAAAKEAVADLQQHEANAPEPGAPKAEQSAPARRAFGPKLLRDKVGAASSAVKGAANSAVQKAKKAKDAVAEAQADKQNEVASKPALNLAAPKPGPDQELLKTQKVQTAPQAPAVAAHPAPYGAQPAGKALVQPIPQAAAPAQVAANPANPANAGGKSGEIPMPKVAEMKPPAQPVPQPAQSGQTPLGQAQPAAASQGQTKPAPEQPKTQMAPQSRQQTAASVAQQANGQVAPQTLAPQIPAAPEAKSVEPAKAAKPAAQETKPEMQDGDLPFSIPDMTGIDQDIAAAIQSAMRGGKKS